MKDKVEEEKRKRESKKWRGKIEYEGKALKMPL